MAGTSSPSEPLDDDDGPYHYLYTRRDQDEDRLLTILKLAAEALAGPYRPEEPRPAARAQSGATVDTAWLAEDASLKRLWSDIAAWVCADPRRPQLLERIREAFADGEGLRVLFQGLFGPAPARPTPDSAGRPVLSQREVTVLREIAADRSHEEIAVRLSISRRTVERHVDNLYRALGVRRPLQAVARGIALGYLPLDALQFLTEAAHTAHRGFDVFHTALHQPRLPSDPQALGGARALAGFGLLLLLLAGETGRVLTADQSHAEQPAQGGVWELECSGAVVRTFGAEHLCQPIALAEAPPAAARQGFTPGHLFVVDGRGLCDGLNEGAIVEFTPRGEFVRRFAGGADIATRLAAMPALAFAADGALLAGSDSLTDAILRFTKGGARVVRLADICPVSLAVRPDGRIYAVQVSSVGCVVKVFDRTGALVSTVGGTPAGMWYRDLVVTPAGSVLVTRFAGGTVDPAGVIEEYDPDGVLVCERAVPGLVLQSRYGGGSGLAGDALGRLYVVCSRTGEVRVLDGAGKPAVRIPLPPGVLPLHIQITANRTIRLLGLTDS